MKWSVLILVFTLGLFIIGSSVYAFIDFSELLGRITGMVTYCTDSDGGLNYYTKGVTKLSWYSREDRCTSDGKKVIEYYCSGNALIGKMYTCPNGCKDGACISIATIAVQTNQTNQTCEDSDGGKNYYVKGNASGSNGIFTDYCIMNDTLVEYYCSGDLVLPEYHMCDRCLNGACIIPNQTCEDSDNGKNYYVKGITQGVNGNFSDFCYSNKTLIEYYCSGSSVLYTRYRCNCSNGVCINQTQNLTHKVCQNGKCVTVSGQGVDECQTDSECVTCSCIDLDNYTSFAKRLGIASKVIIHKGNVTYEYRDVCTDINTIREYSCSSDSCKPGVYEGNCSHWGYSYCSEGACRTPKCQEIYKTEWHSDYCTPKNCNGTYLYCEERSKDVFLILKGYEYREVCARYTDEIRLKRGWNLISLPFVPPNASVEYVLSDCIQKGNKMERTFYRYSSETGYEFWPDFSEMKTGEGYWLYLTNECSLSCDGFAAPNEITLNKGWNLIGFPNGEVMLWPFMKIIYGNETFSISEAASEGLIQPTLSYYDNGYRFVTLDTQPYIEPGRGYWLYAMVPGLKLVW